MAGLAVYLAGPGYANEHTEPHVVAGDPAVMAWHSDQEMSRDSALALARHLDRPKKAFDVEVKQGHVWHCSLSLRPGEGPLSDETWAEIAQDFMEMMDFIDPDEVKAPVRWAAVRHGLTKQGGDHIHIAANVVREDGTKWYKHRDFAAAQKAARALEAKYGLEVLEGPGVGRATRGYDQGERWSAARAKARAEYDEQAQLQGGLSWSELSQEQRDARIAAHLSKREPQHVLATKVRACATAAKDEAEFVRRLRRAGLKVRPRFAAGTSDVVTGYSVAERSTHGERNRFHAGGYLGRDLTLSRLREQWEDSPEAAMAASAEWQAAQRGRRPVAPGRETAEPTLAEWKTTNERLDELVRRVREVPLDDRETWASVARQTSGAMSAMSHSVEQGDGPIGEAAEALSRSAQTYKPTPARPQHGLGALTDAAMLLASIGSDAPEKAMQVVMLRSLMRLAQASYEAARADAQLQQATKIKEVTYERLMAVRSKLERQPISRANEARVDAGPRRDHLDPEARAMLERSEQAFARPAGGALPSDLQRRTQDQKPVTPIQGGRSRDHERE